MRELLYIKAFFRLKLKHELTEEMSRQERVRILLKTVLNLKNISQSIGFSMSNCRYNKKANQMITLQLIETEIKQLLTEHIQEIRKQRRLEDGEIGYIGHYALLGISSHIECRVVDKFSTEIKKLDLSILKRPYYLDCIVFTLLNKNLLGLNMLVRSYSYSEISGLRKLVVSLEDVVNTPIFHRAIIHPDIFTGADTIYFPEHFSYDLKQLAIPYEEVCSFIDRL